MKKTLIFTLIKGLCVVGLLFAITYLHVKAQNNDASGEYYTIETVVLEDGTTLEKIIINGPPTPQPGYDLQRQPVEVSGPNAVAGAYTIPEVPAFSWSMGCSATSAAMIAGYYDRTTLPNMYNGPANGGVVPLDNSIWGTWIDGHGDTYGQTPLSATRYELDGRDSKGHIDDYWVQYGSTATDPFVGHWTEHTYGECTGDYMKTNQTTNYGNSDGSTSFTYFTSSSQMTCSYMETHGISAGDGAYGWKLFYESRGYTVSTCYTQRTDNEVSGGFSFANYKAEIDAGYPVMIHVAGHTMVGVGYNDTGNTVYLHDTWDYSTHSMTWGGSYDGMEMRLVSIVHVNTLSAPTLLAIDNSDGDGNYLVDWTNVSGATSYTLEEDDNDSFSSPTVVYNNSTSQYTVSDHDSGTYYYRVRATNASQLSVWSNTQSTTVSGPSPYKVFVPLVFKNYTTPSGGWVDIMTEDFEGSFPAGWWVGEGSGSGSGVYIWGKRDCQAYEGSYSGWGVGGGTDGSALSCGSNYPNGVRSWMIFGPFSLENAQEAELDYARWLYSEYPADYLFIGASIDGSNFTGYGYAGDSSGWFEDSFDLTDVGSLGDLTGQTQVWVGFMFYSNSSVNYANGAFIDDIVLRECDSNCTTGLVGSGNYPRLVDVKEMHLER